MKLKPLPEAHFTPDGLFVFFPKNREVAMGLKPYRPNGQGCGLFVIFCLLAFLLFGLVVSCGVLLPSAVSAWNSYFRLREQQATTTAQIVDKSEGRSTTNGETDKYITYAFTHPDRNGEQQQYTNTIRVGGNEYRRLREGQAITVYFVPDDPTISQPTPPSIADPITASLFRLAIAVGLLGGGGVMTFLLILSLSRARRLAQHGQLLRGTLTHIEQIKSDGDTYVKARYQFQSPLGNVIEVWFPREGPVYATGDPSFAGYALPPLGTPVAVWYADDKTYTLL